jgi:hypothetical protein
LLAHRQQVKDGIFDCGVRHLAGMVASHVGCAKTQ